jgi:hypothetical protein
VSSSISSVGLDLLSSALTPSRLFLGIVSDFTALVEGLPLFLALSSTFLGVGVKNPFATIDPCFFTCVLAEDGGRLMVVGGVANPFRRDVSGRCAFLVEEVGAVWIHLVGSGRNRGF